MQRAPSLLALADRLDFVALLALSSRTAQNGRPGV